MIVVLLGPPGSGKGTQKEILCAERGMIGISTGDLLREAVSSGSELGMRVKDIMSSGELVSDEIVIELISDVMASLPDGGNYLFDGFPRTKEQAARLDVLMADAGFAVDKVINFVCEDDIVVGRILSRAKIDAENGVKRADDDADVIRNRLKNYAAQIGPLVSYYELQGNLVEVDCTGSVDDVANAVRELLG